MAITFRLGTLAKKLLKLGYRTVYNIASGMKWTGEPVK